MTDLTNPPPPEATPLPVADSTSDAPVRAADGKFVSKEAPTPAETPSATTEQTETEAKQPEKVDEPKRNRAQERIAQITAEKHAAIREAAALRQQLEALHSAPKAQVDPNDYDAQQREGMRQVIREETTQQTVQKYQDAVSRAQQAQFETFKAKVEAARERIPDLDRSLEAFNRLPVSDHAAEIIAESEVAAEIAHYLANNPREAYDIANMTPAQQGRALARIEGRVSLPVRRTTTAPPPVPTVTGAQATRAKTATEMSAAEYIAHRKAEWAKSSR